MKPLGKQQTNNNKENVKKNKVRVGGKNVLKEVNFMIFLRINERFRIKRKLFVVMTTRTTEIGENIRKQFYQ